MGKHEYSGAWSPRVGGQYYSNTTFSVGIYEAFPEFAGERAGKSAVKVRVSGYTIKPELVYQKAREICEQLDAGTYAGPKNVSVKNLA